MMAVHDVVSVSDLNKLELLEQNDRIAYCIEVITEKYKIQDHLLLMTSSEPK